MDYAGPYPNGKHLFIITDEFSKYPFVEVVPSTKFVAVEPFLEQQFALFGSPEKVRTDNGPPFNGNEFAKFAKKFNFKHIKSTLYWPEANGSAERFVRTLQKCLIGSNLETKNFTGLLYTFLANYRSARSSATGKSPYELMFNRQPKTSLPEIDNNSGIPQAETKTIQNKIKAKKYADQKRHTKPNDLKVGDSVICKQPKCNKLTPKYDPEPYKIVTKAGTKITATRNDKCIQRNASFFKRVNFPIGTFGNHTTKYTSEALEELTRQNHFTDRSNPPNPEQIGEDPTELGNEESSTIADTEEAEETSTTSDADDEQNNLDAANETPGNNSRPRRIARQPVYLQDYETD